MNGAGIGGANLEILYLGSKNGLERDLVRGWGWPYAVIPVGKLRRYWDWQNFLDPFRIVAGFFKAMWLIHRFKPDVMFSKGGYVSLPVMAAAWCLHVPVVLHDSDALPSLTTKIAARWVRTLCLGYKEAAQHLPASVQEKITITGVPVREDLLHGSVKKGLELTGFDRKKPIVLVMGGSLGAQRINETVREALPQFLKHCQLIHLAGKGKSNRTAHPKGYKVFEYVSEELVDLYAISDVIVSRAGASAIAEIEALGKPCVLIPIGKRASHGDQIANAKLLVKRGNVSVISDEELNPGRLFTKTHDLCSRVIHSRVHTPQSPSASAAAQVAEAVWKGANRP
jgi:UDP-N-acetylglucosamine--N-acetylmuramyl-(pentapeptide) pyrophosphoryl-undecaprenol N-acetylglucosamine transferase